MSQLIKEAERNADDDLIHKRKVKIEPGTFKTVEVNVSRLFSPGLRRTGNIEHLLIEAELYANGEGGGNPAKPVNSDVAKRAIERIKAEGLEPAWRQVDLPVEYP